MTAKNIMINNIKVNDIAELMAANYGGLYSIDGVIDYVPYQSEKRTFVSLQLLVSMFGLTIIGDEHTDSFIVRRGDKEVRLGGTYDLVPLDIFTDIFNIRGEWQDSETINILDPVTLPYYSIFNEFHSIDKINQVFMFDMDSDGNNEMYVAYYDNQLLQLAVLNEKGQWFFDNSLKGLSVFEMVEMQIGAKRALAVVTPTGVHATIIYLFVLDKNRLINIALLDSLGNGRVIGDEIHFIYRFYDTADHGIKVIYGWDENMGRFIEKRHTIFYWFDYNRVDLKNAESVVCGFCEAIALGLEGEALSYCSPDIRYAFAGEGLKYSVKHPTINIRRMIDHYEQNSFSGKILQLKEKSSSDDKKLFIAYYSELGQNRNPHQVYRLVLQKVEERWEVLDINFLYNQLPTEIKYAVELDLKAVYPIFSLFTCFSLDSPSFINVNLHVKYSNDKLVHHCLIDRCTTVELVELFPGVQLSFFREDLRLCYFTIENAEEVVLDKKENNVSITVILVGESN